MGDPFLDRAEPREPEQLEHDYIAVCIPAYKSYRYLGEFFHSLYAQDYPKDRIHLLFVVTGKDPTIDMVNSYVASFGSEYASARVKELKQFRGGDRPQIRNLTLIKNVMVEMNRGLDCIFLNSDMILPTNAFTSMRNDTSLGASIVGGINPNLFIDKFEGKNRTRIALPMFIVKDNKGTVFVLHGDEHRGWVGNGILGKRIWVDSVSCAIVYVKAEVLNKIKFKIPSNRDMSEDVLFCIEARWNGFKVLSDLNVYCYHWGHELIRVGQDEERTYFEMSVLPEMISGKKTLKREKSY